jgi:hypothetical protein
MTIWVVRAFHYCAQLAVIDGSAAREVVERKNGREIRLSEFKSVYLIGSIVKNLRIGTRRFTLFDVVLRGPHVDYFDRSVRTAASGFDPRLTMAREGVRVLLPSLGFF